MTEALRLAVRSLARRPRRTLLLSLAIANAVAGGLLFYGFTRHTYWGLAEVFARGGGGHLVVADPEWFVAPDPEAHRVERDRIEVARQALLADPEIAAAVVGASVRREVMGLLTAHGRSAVFVGRGTEPEAEAALAPLLGPVEGEPLASEAPDGVVLGRPLAARLGVRPGDTVTALVTTDSGLTNGMDLIVRGLAVTGSEELDRSLVQMPATTAAALVDGTLVDSLVVALDQTEATARVLAASRRVLAGPAGNGLAVVPWYERASYYRAVKALYDRIFGVFEGLMALVTVLSLTHAVAAVVGERRAEIAMLRVVGLRRRQVAGLFVAEGLLLGVAGCVLGVALAAGVGGAVEAAGGIPMPPPPGFTTGYAAFFRVDGLGYAIVLPATLLCAVGASAVPAWRATRGALSRGLAGLVVVVVLLPGIARADEGAALLGRSALPPGERCVVDLVARDGRAVSGWRVAVQGADALAVTTNRPEGRRQAALRRGGDTWFQTEAMRTAMKVGASQRAGGQLVLGDLLSPRLSDAWTAAGTRPGPDGTTVVARSLPGGAWHAAEFDFDRVGTLVAARFQGPSGRVVRVVAWTWEGGRLARLDVQDAARPDQRTVVELSAPRCAPGSVDTTPATLLGDALALGSDS